MSHSDRIIAHMNRDHQLALGDYLVVYGKVESLDETTPIITEIDPTSFTLAYTAKGKDDTYTLKWADAHEHENIAVKEWVDIKSKLVAMAKYAAERRGYAHTKITTVIPPSPAESVSYLGAVIIALNAFYPGTLRSLFASSSFLSKVIEFVPGPLASLYGALEGHSGKIGLAVLVVHVLELVFIGYPILQKHRVPAPQKAAWTIMQMFEGFPSILRLKSLTQ